jgi:antirestriction protein ArdC
VSNIVFEVDTDDNAESETQRRLFARPLALAAVLKADKRAIFSAASKAAEASAYLSRNRP